MNLEEGYLQQAVDGVPRINAMRANQIVNRVTKVSNQVHDAHIVNATTGMSKAIESRDEDAIDIMGNVAGANMHVGMKLRETTNSRTTTNNPIKISNSNDSHNFMNNVDGIDRFAQTGLGMICPFDYISTTYTDSIPSGGEGTLAMTEEKFNERSYPLDVPTLFVPLFATLASYNDSSRIATSMSMSGVNDPTLIGANLEYLHKTNNLETYGNPLIDKYEIKVYSDFDLTYKHYAIHRNTHNLAVDFIHQFYI
uniref:Uncharacterized protein n=1 Tax=Cacopsylla melanoneura TaxID=428564 RepID=A0A8D9E975_9HEMI